MGKKKDGYKKNKKYGWKKKSGKKKSGGDKGMKYYKDKGAKKKGFKKSYHKVEWGDKKKYHNNWRYSVEEFTFLLCPHLIIHIYLQGQGLEEKVQEVEEEICFQERQKIQERKRQEGWKHITIHIIQFF